MEHKVMHLFLQPTRWQRHYVLIAFFCCLLTLASIVNVWTPVSQSHRGHCVVISYSVDKVLPCQRKGWFWAGLAGWLASALHPHNGNSWATLVSPWDREKTDMMKRQVSHRHPSNAPDWHCRFAHMNRPMCHCTLYSGGKIKGQGRFITLLNLTPGRQDRTCIERNKDVL
jgi:hypothetical protein